MVFKSILLAIISTMLSGNVSATPVYYTFSGTVNWIIDGAGIISDGPNAFSFGTAVSYTWEVDYDAPGYIRNEDGSEGAIGNYYTRLLSGWMMDPADVGLPYDEESTALKYYGWNTGSFINVEGGHYIETYGLGDPAELSVGDTGFSIYERVISPDDDASRYQVLGSLTLVNISTVAPIPVPSAVWLFGSGLLALISVARRKKV